MSQPGKPLSMAGFAFCAALLFLYVVFTPPLTGMADNNDFSRSFYGIAYIDRDYYYSTQKFVYVNTEYAITPFPYQCLTTSPSLSPVYSVYAGRLLSRMLGHDTFQMSLYCWLTGGVYILLLTALYGMLLPRKPVWRAALAAAMLFVFMDGCWTVWWYSLYGEPHILIGMLSLGFFFLLFLRAEGWHPSSPILPLIPLLGIGMSGHYLLGAKLQAVSLLPAVAMLIAYLIARIWMGRKAARYGWLKLFIAALLLPLLLFRGVAVYQLTGNRFNSETLYHSVFYGLLADSPAPADVLAELGLSPELLADVGNHSYLPDDRYVYGGRKTERMRQEFYDKVSNTTIVRYYLTHPAALWRGMNYTASQAFRTDSGIGHFTEADHQRFDLTGRGVRFSLWSAIRTRLPKSLWFLLLVCVGSLAATIAMYRAVPAGRIRDACVFFWSVLAMGVLQFPMPYIFNGRADTAKQLFTFNYVFDIALFVLLVSAGYLGMRFLRRIRR